MFAAPASALLAFRPAGVADIPAIQALADRIWRESYAAMLPPAQIDYMLDWMYGTGKIAGELASGVIWELAEVGCVASGYLSVTTKDFGHAELNKLYLLPTLQGRGHGQAMLARALAIARDRQATALTLRVNKNNTRALRAYERAGFRTVDSIVADIGGGFVMDDWVLARSLQPEVDAAASHWSPTGDDSD